MKPWSERVQVLRLLVIDLGEPWLDADGVLRAYQRVFGRVNQPAEVSADIAAIQALPGDSYLAVATIWDGAGPTPPGIWRAWKPQRFVYLSRASLVQRIKD